MGLIIGSNGKQTLNRDCNTKDALVGSNDSERVPDLSGMAHDLIAGFNYEDSNQLLSSFLGVWSPVLKEISPPGFSWFLPRSLGGLGLPRLREDTETFLQLRMAHYVLLNPESIRGISNLCTLASNSSVSLFKKMRHIITDPPQLRVPIGSGVDFPSGSLSARAIYHLDFNDPEGCTPEKRDARFRIWYKELSNLFKKASRTRLSALTPYQVYLGQTHESVPMYGFQESSFHIKLSQF